MTDIIQFSGDAVDSAAQRLGLELGTATFPNPVDYGVGISGNTIAHLPKTSIDDITLEGGVFRVINTNTGLRPDGFSQYGVLAVWRYDVNLILQIYIDVNGLKASRVVKIVEGVGDWNIELDSGNSVNPLDYGIGGVGGEAVLDANNNIENGLFKVTSSSTNVPLAGTATLLVNRSSNVITQTWDSGAFRYFRRSTNTGDTWDSWRLNFDSGNLINPVDFGLGDYAVGTKSDLKSINLDTLHSGGLFSGYDGNNSNASTGGNPFPTDGGGFSLLSIKGINDVVGEYTTQLATRFTHILDQLRVMVRSSGALGFGEWVDMLHSGNTNLDVFGSDGGAKILAQGVFVNPYKATFLLPLSSNGVPVSITLGLGGFQVTKNGFDNVEDNIPPSRVVLGPRSSYKLAEIEIEGFSGHTSGDPVFLRTVDASTKITVNF